MSIMIKHFLCLLYAPLPKKFYERFKKLTVKDLLELCNIRRNCHIQRYLNWKIHLKDSCEIRPKGTCNSSKTEDNASVVRFLQVNTIIARNLQIFQIYFSSTRRNLWILLRFSNSVLMYFRNEKTGVPMFFWNFQSFHFQRHFLPSVDGKCRKASVLLVIFRSICNIQEKLFIQ